MTERLKGFTKALAKAVGTPSSKRPAKETRTDEDAEAEAEKKRPRQWLSMELARIGSKPRITQMYAVNATDLEGPAKGQKRTITEYFPNTPQGRAECHKIYKKLREKQVQEEQQAV